MRKSSFEGYVDQVILRVSDDSAKQQFPLDLPAFRNFTGLELDPAVTFFIGENGSGKSTMLEGIAVALDLSAEGGSHEHNFSTFQTHSKLHESLVLRKPMGNFPKEKFFLRGESFYNVATYVTLNGGPAPRFPGIHRKSHGESFLDVLEKIGRCGLYLFDEPESALSPQRLLTLLGRMHELIALKSQFIIATHSPILLAYPGATIYEFSEAGIHKVNYEDTQHYRLTLDFLSNREAYLQAIFRSF